MRIIIYRIKFVLLIARRTILIKIIQLELVNFAIILVKLVKTLQDLIV